MNKEINSHQKQREWFGKIPFNWQSAKLKRLIKSASSGGTPDSSNDSFYSDAGVPWVTISDITNSSQIKNTAKHITDEAINDKNLKIYPKGTILLAMYASVGKVAELCTEASINQAILAISVDTSKMSNNYIKFCFNAYEPYIKSESNGTTQFNLNANKVLNLSFPLPTLKEQNEISKWISEKSFDIDQLISNQEKQIEKLKEYRQAIITKAVTKGLDSNAPMKDSGVEWIGEIPENWSTIRIKNVSWLKGRIGWDGLKSSEFIDSGPYLITGTDFSNGSINWKTCAHISEERYLQDELLHIKENDLLITKDGTIGKLAIVKNCPEKVSLNSGVMIIRNDTAFKYSNRYLYYVLQSNQFLLWYELSQSGNSTIKHLYQAQFYNFEFSYPSLNEQSNIANYLDERCSKIGLLLDSFEQKISKLKAYKQSLIYEYVTGKKRVSL